MIETGFIEDEDIETPQEPVVKKLQDSKPVSAITASIWNETVDYDFVGETKKRLSGITKETFEEEVREWSEGFKSLPRYNRNAFRQEIADMEMSFQSNSNYSFESMAIIYSQQVANRTRLTAMKHIVNAHYEIYKEAYKSLDTQAFRLFSKSGGIAADRSADAAHVVAPFSRLVSQAKELLNQIEEAIKNIEFAAFQLSRLLREREALAKLNPQYVREGYHARLTDDDTLPKSVKDLDEDGFFEL